MAYNPQPIGMHTVRNVDRAGVCGLLLCGVSFAAACAIMKCGQKAMRYALPECWHNRVEYQGPHRPKDGWYRHLPEVKRLREQGMLNRDIGEHLGRSEWWAAQIAKKGGLTMRGPGRKSQGA